MRLPDQCAVPVFLRRDEARISTSGRSKRGGSIKMELTAAEVARCVIKR
jgi:hypothetical protein